MNNEPTSKEQLVEELKEIQQQKINDGNSKNKEIICEQNLNILDLYIKEITKYPLLKPEEEKILGSKLKLIDSISIIYDNTKNKKVTNTLNLSLIFSSLIDNESYKIIIESLLFYFKNNEKQTNKNILEKLEKYYKLSNTLNHPLNEHELKKYFDIESKNIKKLSEKDLLIQTKNYIEYQNAFDKMFNSNLRLVVNIAKKYKGNFELLDVINEGNIGLLKAVKGFDSNLGFKFSTYATWWIKRSIKKFVLAETYTMKMPKDMINILEKFKKDLEKIEQDQTNIMSPDEIAKNLSMSVDTVLEYLRYSAESISLDQPINHEKEFTLKDNLEAEENIEQKILQSFLSQDIEILLEDLTDKEKQVIKLRYGFYKYGEVLTLCEIGNIFNLSRERIRQIENIALKKIKKRTEINKECESLKEYLK